MSKSIIASIISSLILAGINIYFFTTNAPVQKFFIDYTGDAVASCVLVVILTGLIAWAVCESAWRVATRKLKCKPRN